MKTLLRLAVPSMGMMLLNTLVFLADSIFVSWIGEEQIAAISLSFPVAITLFGFMDGVASGTTALVGQNLGRGNRREARITALSGLTLAYALFFLLLPLLFRTPANWLFNHLGAMNNPSILESAYLYNFWWPIMTPFLAYTFILNSVSRCQGDAVTPLISMVIANVVNIVLDPLFIFTFGMGIEGAAIATLIGRVSASAYLFFRIQGAEDLFLPLFPRLRHIFLRYWLSIARIGFPVTLSTCSIAIGYGWLNNVLVSFGNYAVVAYMMSLRIEDFAFTIISGTSTALIPFLAYNYGKRDLGRMTEGMKAAAVITVTAIFVVGSIILIFSNFFIDLFKPSPEAARVSVYSVRFAISAYPFIIAQFIMNCLFVATGYSHFGLIMQLIRAILVRVPSAYFFAWLWGIRGIWAFQPASWLFGSAAGGLFLVYLLRRIKRDFIHGV